MTTELFAALRRQPWWNSRFMWGLEAARFMVVEFVWRSRYSFIDLGDVDEALA